MIKSEELCSEFVQKTMHDKCFFFSFHFLSHKAYLKIKLRSKIFLDIKNNFSERKTVFLKEKKKYFQPHKFFFSNFNNIFVNQLYLSINTVRNA